MSVPLSGGNQNVYQLNARSNNDPRQFYDIHDHHSQGHFLDHHQSQGLFADQHTHQTSNVLAVPSHQHNIDQHQLLHANMNANMMRFMRNANAGKVYQKIVRMAFQNNMFFF